VTSLREALRRLIGRDPQEAARAADLSYTIYWTRQAQAWTEQRRRLVGQRVEALIARSDFSPNLFRRDYRVPELDDQGHAGASLQALLKVLRALQERKEGEP
jgi:hypothetical protein